MWNLRAFTSILLAIYATHIAVRIDLCLSRIARVEQQAANGRDLCEELFDMPNIKPFIGQKEHDTVVTGETNWNQTPRKANQRKTT